KEKIRKIASKVNKIIVIDRSISFGSEGAFFTETKACLYNEKDRPEIWGVIIGLGGRDVTVEDITKIAKKGKDGKFKINEINWWGVKL
ncbi:MAG: pyruvate ferredoxin oxidoreductase, partial [Methanomicrobia archaeon]|nr:pyruvate ferredoxin oxidoreductase [Methanomicrobia archaeon]